MKKVITALASILIMVSCKKESTINPLPVTTVTKKLLKTTDVFNSGTPETAEYSYDTQGRISKIIQDSRTYTFDFTSASTLAVTERKNADNSIFKTYECTINPKGNMTKMVIKDAAGALYFTYDYTYDADGYMTNQKGTYPYGSTLEFVYTTVDGNLVSSKLYYDNVLNRNIVYTYNNTLQNKNVFGFGSYWNVYNLFGKGSKNLVNEYKAYNASGTLTSNAQFSYETDAEGYPVKETTIFPLEGNKRVYTSTYE